MNQEQPNRQQTQRRWLARENVLFCLGLASIAAIAACLAVYAGRRLLISGHLWPPDLLFGIDTLRGIDTISRVGYHNRDNVHPYFYRMVQPLGQLVMGLGVTPGMAAILINAGAGAAGLILTGIYFRQRKIQPIDALLGVSIMAATATFLIESALPDTFMFTMAGFAALHVFLAHVNSRRKIASLKSNWILEIQWLALGLILYGITVTNGMIAFIARLFALRGVGNLRAWLRAGAYGAAVLAGGVLISVLCGSSLDLLIERRWISDPAFHGAPLDHPVAQSVWTFLAWSVVAPEVSILPTLDDRGMYFIGTFSRLDYDFSGWLLTPIWIVIWLTACASAVRDREETQRALNSALAWSLAFGVIVHVFYHISYEGMFLYSGHTLFFVIGLLSSLLVKIGEFPSRQRTLIRGGMLIFAIALAWRHSTLLLGFRETIPLPH